MGFVLIIAPMIILQLPLVWILIRFQLLLKVELGLPADSAESPGDNANGVDLRKICSGSRVDFR